jgi:hypothetical protein
MSSEINDAGTDQRLPAGQANLSDAAGDERVGDRTQFINRQQLSRREECSLISRRGG